MTGNSGESNPGCDNNYHRTIIGKYSGRISVSLQEGFEIEPVNCEWDVDFEITGFGPTLGNCGLTMTQSTVNLNQLTVLAADDENVYQCIEAEGSRTISGPFSAGTTQEALDSAEFPIVMNTGVLNAEDEGPYFNDSSIRVPWFQLLSGNRGRLLENTSIVITGDGQMELAHKFEIDLDTVSVLTKE